jgi:hypothetical protein
MCFNASWYTVHEIAANKIRTKAPNFALTKELNENTNKSTKFWLKVWQDWALAREYDVDIEKYPILSC